jgi:NAD(P)-dependent dehydrogenase (short-subunit alcohol dehydrogenase family)
MAVSAQNNPVFLVGHCDSHKNTEEKGIVVTDTRLLGLEGKKALVIGGGSGIGRATCLMLAEAGADVVVGDLSTENAKRVATEVASYGVRAGTVGGDVTVEKDAIEAVRAAAEFHGDRLDVLVNIVGFAAWKTIFEIDDETWQLDISRNLTQHLYVSRAAGRHMIDHGTAGRLALVASVSGIYGAPNHGAYGAAKAGVMDLVRTMSQEWAPHGIRVNAVAPDSIATPRVRASYEGQGVDLADRARETGVPLGRFGVPEEIAGPLLFLVSDLSNFVTGQTIIVDGGMRAAFPHVKSTTIMSS